MENVRLRLAGLCARSEQCESDLRKKIFRTGLSQLQADEIIDYLRANRYLDDYRYARAYYSDKIRFSGWGMMKIRRGLLAKRIPAEAISEAESQIDRSEYLDALKKVGIAKARTLELSLPENRAKLFRYLASRGFESEIISKFIDALMKKLKS